MTIGFPVFGKRRLPVASAWSQLRYRRSAWRGSAVSWTWKARAPAAFTGTLIVRPPSRDDTVQTAFGTLPMPFNVT